MNGPSRQHNGDLLAGETAHAQVQQLLGSTYGDMNISGNSRVHAGNVINHFTFVLHRERTLSIAPEERIGVTASIAGLFRQAEALHASLDDIYRPISSLVLDQWEAKDLFEQLQVAKQCLVDLQKYLSTSDLPQSRAALINADQLVASFTNAVLLFRDIQKDLYYWLQPDPTVSDEQYNEASSRIPGITKRLTEQNRVWTLQLEILTSANDTAARRVSRDLDARIATILAENADLKSRMDGLEQEVRSRARTSTIAASEVMSMLEQQPADQDNSGNEPRFSWSPREFEKVLALSRVYRQNKRGSEVFDFDSSVVRSHAWSRLSDLTLSNVSVISVIALPVNLSEVDDDGEWYKEEDLHTIPEAAGYDFESEEEDDDATIRGKDRIDSPKALSEELDNALFTAEHPGLSGAGSLSQVLERRQRVLDLQSELALEATLATTSARIGAWNTGRVLTKKINELREKKSPGKSKQRFPVVPREKPGSREDVLQQLFPPPTPWSAEAFEESMQKAAGDLGNGSTTTVSDDKKPRRDASFPPNYGAGQFEHPRAPPVAPKRPVHRREYPDPGPPPPVPSIRLADQVSIRLAEAEDGQMRSGEAKQERMHPAESLQQRMRLAEAEIEREFFESTYWHPLAATPRPVAPRFPVPTGPSTLFDWTEQEPRWPKSNAGKASDTVAEVLFLCASLFDFNLEGDRREAGYPYLTYAAGEVFEVVRQKDELWLARNEDDPEKKLGWIWEKHVAKLLGEDESDAGAQSLLAEPETNTSQERGPAANPPPNTDDMPESEAADPSPSRPRRRDPKDEIPGVFLDPRMQEDFEKSAFPIFHKRRKDGSLEILFTCTSLCNSERMRSNEIGYRYHVFSAGAIFDVVALKGDLWLARSHGYEHGTLGWVWRGHFETPKKGWELAWPREIYVKDALGGSMQVVVHDS